MLSENEQLNATSNRLSHPPPPTEPTKPQLQVSAENVFAPMPDKSKLLNEKD